LYSIAGRWPDSPGALRFPALRYVDAAAPHPVTDD